MTDDELAAIERRADAATPGPWEWSDLEGGWGEDAYCCLDSSDQKISVMHGCGVHTDGVIVVPNTGDKEFIRHSRLDVPALVAEVRRLRAEVAEYEKREEQRESDGWERMGEDR